MNQPWKTLTEPSARFSHIRQEIHWALYPTASVSATLLPLHPDQRHTCLLWSDNQLMGQEVRPFKLFKTALDIARLQLHLLGHEPHSGHMQYQPVGSFSLGGHTLEQTYTWLEQTITDYMPVPLDRALCLPEELHWHLPHHPLEAGAIFSPSGPAHQEIHTWLSNAAHVLEIIYQDHTTHSNGLHCWPAAFELSLTLRLVDHDLRVGFSLGDKLEQLPYFFVSPWPVPAHAPKAYALGHWNETPWKGVLLPASQLLDKATTAEAQQARALYFLRDAIARLR